MSNSGLTVGIVGLGAHGVNYTEILTSLGHEVYGVDAEPHARREFQDTFDTATFEDPMELFEADVDAVIICTPTKFHEATTTSALENGLDVLVETPLGHDLSSAEHIASVAEETGNICMVAFYERFRNICQVTKSYLKEGYFGEVTHVHAKFIRRRGVPGRGTWYTSQDVAGGGALMDVGGHLLDLLLYFLDWPELTDAMATSRSDFGPQEDYAYLRMWGEDGDAKMYDVEDSVTAFCEFDDGTTASVEVAWAANVQSEHSYTIRGTEAGAHLDITDTIPEVEEVPETRNSLELFEARSGVADHFVNSEVVTSQNDRYHSMMQTFVDAVFGDGRPTANNIHQGLAVQRAIDKFYGASSD
jgi:predicted dehydrogenase